MDLSKISVQVRPRNPYEAIDLGVVMARQWYIPLMMLWLVPAAPIMLLSFLVFRDQPLWALLLVWWLKPLFESIQLRYISEKLFDDQVGWKNTLKDGHRIAFHQWFSKLVLQRLSFSRSFNMPVGELEQLTGKRRSQRLGTLHRGAGSSGMWLTLVGHSIESIMVIAVFSATWMLVPVEMDIDFDLDVLLASPMLFPTITWAGFAAMTLASPLYVCAGFMLYINRRTWLEAWDIELTFRQLTADYNKAGVNSAKTTSNLIVAVVIFTIASTLFFTPTESRAESPTPAESQTAIIEILEGESFHQLQEEPAWRWKNQTQPDQENLDFLEGLLQTLESFLKSLSFMKDFWAGLGSVIILLEIILWGFVIALVGYLIYRFRHLTLPQRQQRNINAAAPPSHLFGLELNQDTLPEDVIAAAQALWQQQQFRQALSLLYRAALTFLVHERHLPLNNSHTEQECLHICLQQEPKQRGQFFSTLTQHWIKLAYAHTTLSEDEFSALCHQWPELYQNQAPVNSGEAQA